VLSLLFNSGCTFNTKDINSPEIPNDCEETAKIVTEKLTSSDKIDLISGWQLMIDKKICFPTADFELVRNQLKILKE